MSLFSKDEQFEFDGKVYTKDYVAKIFKELTSDDENLILKNFAEGKKTVKNGMFCKIGKCVKKESFFLGNKNFNINRHATT